MLVNDGKGQYSVNDIRIPGCFVGAYSPGHSGDGPTKFHGTQAGSPEADLERHHIPGAHRLPVETSPLGAGGRQHVTQCLSALGRVGVLERIWAVRVGRAGRGVRGTGRYGPGVADGKLCHG